MSIFTNNSIHPDYLNSTNNQEIAIKKNKKTDSLAQKIKDYIIENNIPNKIEYN